MASIEFTIEDQMDVLEARFYGIAQKFGAEKGLHDYKVNSADANYLLDTWLDLRLQLGKSAVAEVAYYGD